MSHTKKREKVLLSKRFRLLFDNEIFFLDFKINSNILKYKIRYQILFYEISKFAKTKRNIYV